MKHFPSAVVFIGLNKKDSKSLSTVVVPLTVEAASKEEAEYIIQEKCVPHVLGQVNETMDDWVMEIAVHPSPERATVKRGTRSCGLVVGESLDG